MSRSKHAFSRLILLTTLCGMSIAVMPALLLPQTNSVTVVALLAGLLASLSTMAVVYWRVIGPLAKLSAQLQSCTDEQEACTAGTARYESNPFVGELATSVLRQIANFYDLGKSLSNCGGNISIAAAEVSHFIDQLKKKIESDVREITEIASSTTQMAQSSSQMTDSAGIAASAATRTRDESLQGRRRVQGAIEQIHGVSNSVVQTSGLVAKLQQHSDRIQGIAHVINGLADQTNLLALNAAIEAARAGEHGRGFSVVADEVRGLANKTASATGEIGEMLQEVHKDTAQVAGIMTNLVQHMEEMVISTEQVGTLLEEIGSFSEQSEVKVQHIVESINESASATSHISESVNVVRQGLERSEQDIQTVSNQALALSDMGEQIYELLSDLNLDTIHGLIAGLARQASEQIQAVFEQAIRDGRISQADLFDRNYRPIERTDPLKYETAYDRLADKLLRPIQEPILKQHKAIVYAIATDPNGYVPTHNERFSKPLSGDYAQDLVNNRTKRIFDDRTGARCGSHTKKVLLQTYKRDTGEVMHDLSVPIMVDGRHWGGFRIGYKSKP
jgi:methyl-accepting chemotaxis protein